MVLERLELSGKVAVVTGAGRGLGRQMALHLAEAGADIVCAARTLEQIEATAQEIRNLGRRALVVPTDVRDSAQVDGMVARCLAEFGRIDIMLANAGGGGAAGGRSLFDCSDDQWRDTVDLNLSSAFYCARAAAAPMRERGGGVIVTVASGEGMRGQRATFAYGAAKGGVIALTKQLAIELAPYGIRVNCIVPGFVAQRPAQTPQEEELRRQRGRFIPVGRIGEAWELGPLAVYLCSQASSYVTGQAFIIDGGGLAGGYAPTGYAPQVELTS